MLDLLHYKYVEQSKDKHLFTRAGFSMQRNENEYPEIVPSDFVKIIVTLFLSSRNFFVLLLFSSLTRLKKCKRCP